MCCFHCICLVSLQLLSHKSPEPVVHKVDQMTAHRSFLKQKIVMQTQANAAIVFRTFHLWKEHYRLSIQLFSIIGVWRQRTLESMLHNEKGNATALRNDIHTLKEEARAAALDAYRNEETLMNKLRALQKVKNNLTGS